MALWVVKVTRCNDYWDSSVDSVWTSELAAKQRADYIHANDDQFGDSWDASVMRFESDQCTAWPREARDR